MNVPMAVGAICVESLIISIETAQNQVKANKMAAAANTETNAVSVNEEVEPKYLNFQASVGSGGGEIRGGATPNSNRRFPNRRN